jgi:hypothetical protein
MGDLAEGVDVSISDQTGSIRNSRLIDPTVALGEYKSIEAALSEGRAQALTADQADSDSVDWDVIVVYRVSGFCGRPPSVDISGTSDALSVAIQLASGGDCDALEYDEALVFSIAENRIPAHVDATIK